MNHFYSYMRSKKWSLVLILLIGLFLFIMFKFNVWNFWGIPHMEPVFADSYIILAASDCYQMGYDVYKENPCDVVNRVYPYPRIWLWIGAIGLTREHNNIVGALIITVFLLLSVNLIHPKNLKEFFISAVLLLSPTVMLGVERANTDLLMFTLLGLAVYFMFSKVRILNSISYLCIYVATFLKLYPAASFVAFIKHIKSQKRFWLLVIFSVVIIGSYFFFTYSDLLVLRKIIPKPTGRFAFGATQFLISLGVEEFLVIFTLLMGCLAFFLSFIFSSKTGIAGIETSSINIMFFLIGSFNIFFFFFVHRNFCYRCIYFIFTLPYLFELLKNKKTCDFTKRLIGIFFISLFIIVWIELPISASRLIASALRMQDLTFYFMKPFVILMHLMSWVVITVLLVLNIELLKKSAYDKILWLFARQKQKY